MTSDTTLGRRYLGDLANGHDNNFKLLRFVAATLVLVSHSFALVGMPEPLRDPLGITWGSIAVDIFFVTSGFLVTGSLLKRQSIKGFLLARFLRIFPALWVSLFVTVVLAGFFFSSLSIPEFYAHHDVWKFLLRNGTLLLGLQWTLPGVFGGDPVNGSLWSLPAEVKMYLILCGLWVATTLLKVDRKRWVSALSLCLAAFCVALSIVFFRTGGQQSSLVYLGGMFFSGAALWVLRSQVWLSTPIALLLLGLLLIFAYGNQLLFDVSYRIVIPYLVLYLATVPGGFLRRFNVVGDYSYGMYIYAFPIQQALAHTWPSLGPYEIMGASFVCTMVFAVASWHVLEARFLAFKKA